MRYDDLVAMSFRARRNSLSRLIKRNSKSDHKEDQHPVHSPSCTVEGITRLCSSALDQIRDIPHSKKKKIPSLLECEIGLRQLNSKLRAESNILKRFQETMELGENLLSLQDILKHMSRKLASISKKNFFLDASYGKRMASLHSILTNTSNDFFNCLSRILMQESMNRRPLNTHSTSTSPNIFPTSLPQLENIISNQEPDSSQQEEKIFEESASIGMKNELKLYNMALSYMSDGSCCKDDRIALTLFAQAAATDYVPAIIAVAEMYETGKGCAHADIDVAHHYFSQAADAGVSGKVALALFYLRISKDRSIDQTQRKKMHHKSLKLFRTAAEFGDAEAQCCLGEYYHTIHQPQKAIAFFRSAVACNHIRAQNNLGIVLASKTETKEAGLNLLEISAQRGFEDAASNRILIEIEKADPDDFNLVNNSFYKGYLLLKSYCDGSKKSFESLQTAYKLFQSTASEGDTRANYFIGYMHETGLAERNLHVSKFNFKLVMEKSTSDVWRNAACFHLAEIYFRIQNFSKAASLYQICAESGNRDALNALGLMLQNGQSHHSRHSVEEWFTMGHDAGCESATVNLALLSYKNKDTEKAFKLMANAAVSGNEYANKILRKWKRSKKHV